MSLAPDAETLTDLPHADALYVIQDGAENLRHSTDLKSPERSSDPIAHMLSIVAIRHRSRPLRSNLWRVQELVMSCRGDPRRYVSSPYEFHRDRNGLPTSVGTSRPSSNWTVVIQLIDYGFGAWSTAHSVNERRVGRDGGSRLQAARRIEREDANAACVPECG